MNLQSWVIVFLIVVIVALAIVIAWLKDQKDSDRYSHNITPTPILVQDASQKQYVRDLDKVIVDAERMAESLTDGEERDLWFLYVQELRVRQLKVIQRVQDKEWRKVRGDSLTREEIREVERVALQEIRRMEERYFNPEDIRKFSMEGRY